MSFDRLIRKIVETKNPTVVGLDPKLEYIPEELKAEAYAKYGKGFSNIGDWRRDNVDQLVREVYSTIKSIDSSVRFGISPQGNTSINYSEQYIDVEEWLSNPGYVDYICPQVYYGFENDTCPFAATVAE